MTILSTIWTSRSRATTRSMCGRSLSSRRDIGNNPAAWPVNSLTVGVSHTPAELWLSSILQKTAMRASPREANDRRESERG